VCVCVPLPYLLALHTVQHGTEFSPTGNGVFNIQALYLLTYFYSFTWLDAMTAYKQIMPRLTTALADMNRYTKVYTTHWVMYHTVHCD